MNIIVIFDKDITSTLMCKRTKEPYKGMYNFVGGKIENDNGLEEAYRELYEETGITSNNLVEIGRVLHHSHKSFYVEYLCITDVDEDSVVLQEGETSDYKWITADELLKLSRDELATQRILNFVEELN